MSIALLGSCGFLDEFTPVKGKIEWGMDTLTRKMIGARSLAEAYIATLAQGQVYQNYYLQAWEPDDDPNVCRVTLTYKGLITGGTPYPDIIPEIVSAVGTTTQDYSTENDGAGRLYQKDVLAQFLGGTVPPPGTIGLTASYFRDRYCTGATMQFTYQALQEKIRYINVGKPSGPGYGSVQSFFSPTFDNARITTSDGAVFGVDRMVFFELTPVQLPARTIFFTAKNVIGTPYYECEEVLRVELGTL